MKVELRFALFTLFTLFALVALFALFALFTLFTLFTLFILFILSKLLYTALTEACASIYIGGKVRTLLEWADGLLSKKWRG